MPFLYFLIFMGHVLESSHGTYRPDFLLFMICFVIYLSFWSYAHLRGERRFQAGTLWKIFLTIAVVDFACILAYHHRMAHVELNEWYPYFRMFLVLKVFCLFPYVIDIFKPWPNLRILKISFFTVIFLLFLTRILVLFVSPQPYIDVFFIISKACDYLMGGDNPYLGVYPDLYGGEYGYEPALNYWPAYVFISIPFHILGDIRGVSIFAEAVIGLLVWRVTSSLPFKERSLLVLLWISFPVHLFIIESAWIEPVLCLGLLITIMLLRRNRALALGFVLGLLGAVKQTMMLFWVLVVFWLGKYKTRRQALRIFGFSSLVFACFLLPFFLWDPPSFYENTIATFLERDLRKDSLSIPALFANVWEIYIPNTIFTAVYVLIGAFSVWLLFRARTNPLKGLLLASFVSYGYIFLFGKQAFANYYYLHSFLAYLYLLFGLRLDSTESVASSQKSK